MQIIFSSFHLNSGNDEAVVIVDRTVNVDSLLLISPLENCFACRLIAVNLSP